MRLRKLLLVTASATFGAVLLVLLIDPAEAVSTRSFRLDDEATLAAGELEGTAVYSTGSVGTSAELRRIELGEVPIAYTFVRGRDGSVYIGTGNDGRVLRLRGDTVSVYAETGQLLVTSLAFGNGRLYAGTLPEGRIYAIEGEGRVTELVRPEGAEHVWALAYDARRSMLYAATGPDGKVFAINAQGQANVYYDSEAGHIMSLALDADGTLYAGTTGEARVLRIRAPGRAEVVGEFPGNEVTSLTVREGMLVAAANEFPDPPPIIGGSTKTKTASLPARPRPGKGRIWRISQDGRSERVFANEEGHFTSVQIADDGSIYAGSGKDGRIYRVLPDRTSATWIDVDERQVLAIDLGGQDPLFLTGDVGAVYRVLPGRPAAAVWTSKALDAEFQARWGELTWRGSGTLELETRSGNTSEPDGTWSDWSAAITSPGPVRSPASRYIQVRARFRAPDAELLAIQLYYLPQNQRAVVTSVGLKPPPSDATAKTKERDALPTPSTRYELAWKVDNPDQDRLRYRLRFKQEGQPVWREMFREDVTLTDAEYTWDAAGVPDGWYIVQVEASDELANPEAMTLRADRQSEPLLIDNHAPRVELRTAGGRIGGRAVDTVGPIARLAYAVDGGEWRLFFPSDGLLDNAEEQFQIELPALPAGSHIVAVRATDAGGNVGSAEITTRTAR